MKNIYRVLILMALLPFNVSADTSIGAGFGVPYGIMGMNIQHALSEDVEASFGLGTSLFAGTAMSIGMRYFPLADSGLRLSVIYGANAVLNDPGIGCIGFYCDDSTLYSGINIGVGWGNRSNQSGWDIDLIYLATSGAFSRADELKSQGYSFIDGDTGPTLKFSFGYHWSLY